jgi:hypothetical protein
MEKVCPFPTSTSFCSKVFDYKYDYEHEHEGQAWGACAGGIPYNVQRW